MEYAKKILDPRWQKLSADIKYRDKWTCMECGETTKTLEVHHLKYIAKEPWLEPEQNLITLCCDCHRKKQPPKYALDDMEFQYQLAIKRNNKMGAAVIASEIIKAYGVDVISKYANG